MKAFIKWWTKKDTENINLKDEITFQDVEDMTVEGWRAALKEVYAQIEKAMVDSSVWDIGLQIKLWIKKELREKVKNEKTFYEDYSYYVGGEITCKRMPLKYCAWKDKRKGRREIK